MQTSKQILKKEDEKRWVVGVHGTKIMLQADTVEQTILSHINVLQVFKSLNGLIIYTHEYIIQDCLFRNFQKINFISLLF